MSIQQTSIQAYEELQPQLPARHAEILHALSRLQKVYGDASDSEIAAYLGKEDKNYVRPRRFELVNEKHLIVYSQTRQCRETKKRVKTWKIVRRISL